MWGVELLVMLAMIGVNAVFAGYEIALASIPLARLQRLAHENRAGARLALSMKQGMEASLAVVQLGITLAGAIAAAVGGAGAQEGLAPAIATWLSVSKTTSQVVAIACVVAPLTVVTIMAGELLPKVFALRNSEAVCLTLSPLMRGFALAVWPAIWLFESAVRGMISATERLLGRPPVSPRALLELQELRASAALARASRLIGHRQESIILGAAELQARPVREIMLPAEHINTLDVEASLHDNLTAAHLDMHTRFPVVARKGDPQSIIGYVNVKDIIVAIRADSGTPSMRSITRQLPQLNDELSITDCLERLMQERTHIALVRDSSGHVVGLVSLEDILEELVGEIEDEYDRLPAQIVPSGSEWIVGGGVPLNRLQAATGIDLNAADAVADAVTIDDWVLAQIQRAARGGDVVQRRSVRITVRKVRRQHVQEALLSRLPAPEERP